MHNVLLHVKVFCDLKFILLQAFGMAVETLVGCLKPRLWVLNPC